MYFSIDVHSDTAIYLQLVRQIKFAIASGTLRPGQLLPSVRMLSQQVALNPNTVSRAFNQLQTDGVIEALRGRGMVVCEQAPKHCRKDREMVVNERIGAIMTEAWNAGLSRTQIESYVQSHLDDLAQRTPTALQSSADSTNGQSPD